MVGASKVRSDKILEAQNTLVEQVQKKIDELDIENDGEGWTAKAFLYCFEVKCPQTGWIVPLLPSFVVSQPRTGVKNNVCVELIPNPKEKRYDIEVILWVEEKDMD